MKYLRFIHPDTRSPIYGILEADKIKICRGEALWRLSETGDIIPLNSIDKYLPPVDPPDVIALGMNYRAHAAETKQPIPKEPLMLLKATSSVVGHRDAIVLPKLAPSEVDYEGELVIVIGGKTRNITENEALDYVFGWTCGNDVTARDCQFQKDGQWARAKSFDTFCPLGPCIETELDPSNVKVQTRVNKRLLQDSSSSDMIFSVETVVSYLSNCMTLQPGTVIMTGTPPGVGYRREPQLYLRPGDLVEVTIDKIGTLENRVSAEQ